jgi:hypothetical protein
MEKVGKDPDYPSLIMVDGQIVKKLVQREKKLKFFVFTS